MTVVTKRNRVVVGDKSDGASPPAKKAKTQTTAQEPPPLQTPPAVEGGEAELPSANDETETVAIEKEEEVKKKGPLPLSTSADTEEAVVVVSVPVAENEAVHHTPDVLETTEVEGLGSEVEEEGNGDDTKETATEKGRRNESESYADDRTSQISSSSSSRSSSSVKRRLVQTTMREMCDRASKRRRLSNNDSPSERARSACDDDAASSLVGRGQAPSVRSFLMLSASEEEEREVEVLSSSGGGDSDTRPDCDNDEAATATTTSGGGQQPRREHQASVPVSVPSQMLPSTSSVHSLYVAAADDETASTGSDGCTTLPELVFVSPQPPRKTVLTKEEFRESMRLRLDDDPNSTHKTDMQLIFSTFDTELDFYDSVMRNATPVHGVAGLRVKSGGSLNTSREHCPAALFPECVPHVLYTEDFVDESEWYAVLVHYFDEYLNKASFLYVMLHVLQRDEHVKKSLTEKSRQQVIRCVQNCLSRFRYDVIGYQKKVDTEQRVKTSNAAAPKQPHREKCTIVVGLIAVCSLAFQIVTPVYTDLAKVCGLLAGTDKHTLGTINTSTVGSKDDFVGHEYDDCLYNSLPEDFDDSVSRAAAEAEATAAVDGDGAGNVSAETAAAANIGNQHSVLASILRWNYTALGDQTLWSLFFYYYHVHTDALTKIMDEVVHGGLMVTAVLQAYFEDFSNNGPVDVRLVCGHVYRINGLLSDGSGDLQHGGTDNDEDHRLMPPPASPFNNNGNKKKNSNNKNGRGVRQTGKKTTTKGSAKRAPKKGRKSGGGGEDDDSEDDGSSSCFDNVYKTSVQEVLTLFLKHYFRPVFFEETILLYTETGYEPCQSEFTAYFSADREKKRTVKDVFTECTLKYVMPHGELLLTHTDVTGTVHRRSYCTRNLVLYTFENLYGGCMTFLTRRYNNRLALANRFNGPVYKLVVECRHAMKEFIRSVDLSQLNLLLRQPVVPPVLETDLAVRHMFMSDEEITKGAFVCLNATDYVRAINMFTRHSKFSQEICDTAETFLDGLIVDDGDAETSADGQDKDTRSNFRTIYLFFLLFIFEVLYKIRHAYHRERTYNVSIEGLSPSVDVRALLKLFFGAREFQMPRGLSADAMRLLDMENDLYDCETGATAVATAATNDNDDGLEAETENKAAAARCVNTRPLVSAVVPDKIARMKELFGKKGLVVMKSYGVGRLERRSQSQNTTITAATLAVWDEEGGATSTSDRQRPTTSTGDETEGEEQERGDVERDRVLLNMPQTRLEEVLYSSSSWYENCRVRMRATRVDARRRSRAAKEMETRMDDKTMDTFLRTQLSVNIENARLEHVERAVRDDDKDFEFCTYLPLRTKMVAFVLATHATKRLTTDVATEFVRKTYCAEQLRRHNDHGHRRQQERERRLRLDDDDNDGREKEEEKHDEGEENGENDDEHRHRHRRPDTEWNRTWTRLLCERRRLLQYCRSLADTHFPHNYFIGLHPENAYNALYNYMRAKPKYHTLRSLAHEQWAKDLCAALNYLLVMNAYDPELVELCLKLFLGFEWPGQWAKRIFVWKSNSNAGKSFFFEHVLRKAFDQSTCINDPKGGRDNAPEKSEYYKNFVLMINEFTTASACELKKLCSTSSYKFRMNFGNHMIHAFMTGKMVFNCNTLPLMTDHATIQRVALVPLPFWFQKRQSVVDAMLNWTKDNATNEYNKKFRQNVWCILSAEERRFFIGHRDTKTEDDLLNEPNEKSLQMLCELNDVSSKASMFLAHNKTSLVYMMCVPHTETIIRGILALGLFCRYRFYSNNLKEPVDYSVLPVVCMFAGQEWMMLSQPYFEWKQSRRVYKDHDVRTGESKIYASLHAFAKTSRNVSFFDLQQFFKWDFVEQKIPHYNGKEDEYYVHLEEPTD